MFAQGLTAPSLALRQAPGIARVPGAQNMHLDLDGAVFASACTIAVHDAKNAGMMGDDLELISETVERFTSDRKATAKTVLQRRVLQHQARRWAKASWGGG